MSEPTRPEIAGLGPVIRVFKPDLIYRLRWVLRLFGSAVVFGLIGWLFINDGWGGMALLVLAGACAVVALSMLIHRLLSREVVYVVCEQGLALVSPEDEPQTIRWEE